MHHARVVRHVVDDLCLPAGGDAARDAFSRLDYIAAVLFCVFAYCHQHREILASRLGQPQDGVARLEQAVHMLGDALQHRLQVERSRHLAPDLGGHRHLVGPALCLLVQACVFQRYTHR